MSSVSDKVVELRDIEVSYGRQRILQGVNFAAEQGEVIALAGPNGSGKSTLMKALIRLELADRGTGMVLGNSLFEDSADYNLHIGYVSEVLDFQVKSNLQQIARLYSRVRSNFSLEDFNRVIEILGLDVSRSAGEYSRGQKIQFAFALAVAARPKLLLLDEVTSVLDIHVRDLIMREVAELAKQGSTALVATNILTEVVPYAHRLIILESGRVELDSQLNQLDHRYLKMQFHPSEIENVSGLKVIKGSKGDLVTALIPYHRMDDSIKENLLRHGKPADQSVTAEDVFLYYCRRAS